MNPTTQAALEELRRARWFACVGVKDTEAADVLTSWAEAIESCSSDEWQELCMEAANQFCQRLVERSPDRFAKWNDLVDAIKPVTERLVREKAGPTIEKEKLPLAVLHSVQWDMLHLCMEAEYADVYPPGFYASQAYWYIKGHFPCGWRGPFPEGKLVIY
jgi:hypothetical protein